MMKTIKSTEMRKDFSFYIDEIVRRKPVFVKRSRDLFLGISFEMMKDLVSDIGFTAMMYMESDGSITLSLNEFDIVVNGKNQEEALNRLVNDLKEYAEEYYEQIEFWYNDPQRRSHFKGIIKVLLTDDDQQLKETIQCQLGAGKAGDT